VPDNLVGHEKLVYSVCMGPLSAGICAGADRMAEFMAAGAGVGARGSGRSSLICGGIPLVGKLRRAARAGTNGGSGREDTAAPAGVAVM